MKVAILAGGAGTRLAEETDARPKPMVEIGGRPILWHIMRHYAWYGHREFVIALGYRGDVIQAHLSAAGSAGIPDPHAAAAAGANGDRDGNWRVEFVDTGTCAGTGSRMRQLSPSLGGGTFMMTYGDGVADVDLDALLAFHRAHGRLATLTAVRPPSRFGCLALDGDRVVEFAEKPPARHEWINGAFFVLEPGVFDYIDAGSATMWEHAPLERLAADGELMAYRHESFWQCMDTLAEKRLLEELWRSGRAPWKVWE